MKTDCKILDSNPPGLMKWHTWTEICDECGVVIQTSGVYKHSQKPNMKEKDLCIKCLREYRESNNLKVGGLK